MKRIHKAIRYLRLALLVSSIALSIMTNEISATEASPVIPVVTVDQVVQADTAPAVETVVPVEQDQAIIPVTVDQVAQETVAPIEVKPAEVSHVEEVIKIFKPFFTEKNYVVKKSFKKMCLEAVNILRKSIDTGLHKIADFLERLSNKQLALIMLDLNNNQVILSPLVPDSKITAPKSVLIDRLRQAVAFKDK